MIFTNSTSTKNLYTTQELPLILSRLPNNNAMDSGSPRPGKTVLVHGLLGITLKECDHILRRNPSRWRVENTYFVPVGQQQCDKRQDLFLLAPGQDLSGVYPGSKRTVVHRILQARILEWVAFPFSRGSSQPRDRT